MVMNRLVTTKQKKFLERTFNCLGISIEEFMEINNLMEFRNTTLAEIENLKKENKFLADINTKQNEIIRELSIRIDETNQKIDDLLLMTDTEA
jgi:FtsZ-binding cell division protein ZapB